MTVPGNTRSYTIDYLAQHTTYYVSVAAVNAVGTGPASVATATTLGLASAPRSVKVKSGQATATVTWTYPAITGGPITGYQVEYRLGTSGAWQTAGSTTGTTYKFLRTGLVNGKKYQFRVTARTATGLGAPSAAVTAAPAGKPLASTKVTTKVKKGKITIKWKKAAANGSAITGYTVQHSTNRTKWKTLKKLKANKTSLVTTKGKKGKVTYFRVIAKNKVGTGLPSAAAQAIR